MTAEELQDIEAIAYCKDPWNARIRLQAYLKTVKVQSVEEVASDSSKGTVATRTGSQNAALHLWFKQIADICQNQGVTFDLIIKHTHQVAVTEIGVKGLWHVLQKALYGTTSTTELKKTGQIDRMIDHFVALFAKEEVELPPFPSQVFNVRLTAMENLQKEDYPQHNKTAFE